jgi:hypothetical protein
LEVKAGRLMFAYRTNIRVKTESHSHKEVYSAELATLFSTTRQMSVIALSAAIGQGLPYRTVPEVNMMLGDGRREKSSRLFFLEVRPHRGTAHPLRVPATFFVAAYGVSKAAQAAPELPLLRERFNVRPSLTKGDLAQRAGPIELVIGRDNMQYWPRVVHCSRTAGDNSYLMKTLFHPGQLLYGEVDRETAEVMRKEARRRLTRERGSQRGHLPHRLGAPESGYRW